jgi:hypothetical protein
MSCCVPTRMALRLLCIVPFLTLAIAIAPQGVSASGAIPLAVRSPYLNSWLPVSTGFAADETYAASSDLSQVCTFL